MPIAFSCPECDHAIKAPDTTAGRKVKCPSCKAVITVPQTSVSAEAPSRPSAAVKKAPPPRPAPMSREDEDDRPRGRGRPRDEEDEDRPARRGGRDEEDEDRPARGRGRDDEEDDRPRRRGRDDKRRQPEKKGKGLLIGLCVGGGVAIIGAVVLIIVLSSGGSGTGGRPPGGGGPPPVGGGAPPGDRALDGSLKQIGLAYHNYFDSSRKGPSKADDLFPFLEGPGSPASQALASGRIQFIYNVKITDMLDGSSNTILAYERDAPTRGGLVLFGDGHTENLSLAEFNAKPQAGKRK